MQRAVNRLARSGEALAAGDLTTVAATVTCAHALSLHSLQLPPWAWPSSQGRGRVSAGLSHPSVFSSHVPACASITFSCWVSCLAWCNPSFHVRHRCSRGDSWEQLCVLASSCSISMRPFPGCWACSGVGRVHEL